MKLFVGSLPYELTENELRELFEEFGNVLSARIIQDRDTGRSKGFGFVEMSEEQEGQSAMKELNGFKVNGRTIVVNRANENRPDNRERRPRQPRRF